jgi:hypothetical protein
MHKNAVQKKIIHLTASITVPIHVQKLIGVQEKTIPAVLYILVTLTKTYGIHRTGLLAEAAEDAPQSIDLIPDGVPFAFFRLTDLQIDTLGRADGYAEAASDTGGLSFLVLVEIVHAAPALRYLLLFLGIRYGDRFREEPPER